MPARRTRDVQICRDVVIGQALEEHVIDREALTTGRLGHACVERPLIVRQTADERQNAGADGLLAPARPACHGSPRSRRLAPSIAASRSHRAPSPAPAGPAAGRPACPASPNHTRRWKGLTSSIASRDLWERGGAASPANIPRPHAWPTTKRIKVELPQAGIIPAHTSSTREARAPLTPVDSQRPRPRSSSTMVWMSGWWTCGGLRTW